MSLQTAIVCTKCKNFIKCQDDIFGTSCGHLYHFNCLRECHVRSTNCSHCDSYKPTMFKMFLEFTENAVSWKDHTKVIELSTELEESKSTIAGLEEKYKISQVSVQKLEGKLKKLNDALNSRNTAPVSHLENRIATLEFLNNFLYTEIKLLTKSTNNKDAFMNSSTMNASDEKYIASKNRQRHFNKVMQEHFECQLKDEINKNALLSVELKSLKLINADDDHQNYEVDITKTKSANNKDAFMNSSTMNASDEKYIASKNRQRHFNKLMQEHFECQRKDEINKNALLSVELKSKLINADDDHQNYEEVDITKTKSANNKDAFMNSSTMNASDEKYIASKNRQRHFNKVMQEHFECQQKDEINKNALLSVELKSLKLINADDDHQNYEEVDINSKHKNEFIKQNGLRNSAEDKNLVSKKLLDPFGYTQNTNRNDSAVFEANTKEGEEQGACDSIKVVISNYPIKNLEKWGVKETVLYLADKMSIKLSCKDIIQVITIKNKLQTASLIVEFDNIRFKNDFLKYKNRLKKFLNTKCLEIKD